MLKKAVIAVDCLIVALAVVGLAVDHGNGDKILLWVTIALISSAQLWRHLTNGR